MKGVQTSFDGLCQRLDAFSQRERLLIVVALLAVVTLLWYTLLIEPLAMRRKTKVDQAASAAAVVAALDREGQAVVAAGRRDPDAENRRQLLQLQTEVALLDERLAALTGELITPRQMVAVLEEMLKRRRNLTLTRLENLPSEPLLEPEADGPPADKGRSLNLFRHPLRIELSGSYLEALAYLQSLEKLPRKLYWQDLAISVENYPRAHISVTVYTLSLEEGWIGV